MRFSYYFVIYFYTPVSDQVLENTTNYGPRSLAGNWKLIDSLPLLGHVRFSTNKTDEVYGSSMGDASPKTLGCSI